MNLSQRVKTTRVSNAVAAGTSDVNSDSIDTAGFDALQFVVAFGTITTGAVTSVKLEGSDDDSNWSDLENTGQTVADDDDNQLFMLDLDQPIHRYVRCTVDRGTQNAVVDSIVCNQYKGGREPVTQPATTNSELHLAPAVGTA